MAKVVDFEEFRQKKIEQSFWDVPTLPTQEEYDLPEFQRLKNRVWAIIWYNYIKELIKVAASWKNIINRLHIDSDNLPYNIVAHLKKVSEEEKKTLWKDLFEASKESKLKFIKEQLFFLRVKILQTIKKW